MSALIVAHLAATWFMTGLIWFVQVVHYPLFARVGNEDYANYQEAHARLTTWVVGPPMLVEAGTAIAIVITLGRGPCGAAWWIAAGLLALIWASTAFLQVPAHGRLAQGFDAKVHRRLVTTNWLRTVAWSVRAWLVTALAINACG
jgi:hypothetical protein